MILSDPLLDGLPMHVTYKTKNKKNNKKMKKKSLFYWCGLYLSSSFIKASKTGPIV